ncbi:RNA polymerase sigma factor [Gillisia marina]|uniref:RNA polymerase sigma factor n=1 Tax=Gillisia marina TaxID=1167637 RepID=UPI00029AB65D|nr:sigma-70 family RNA polymerase sigma factor [Gillisia marina]
MSKEEKFTQLIKENEGIIYKITRIYSNNEADLQDLYQEIVFQLWKSFDDFRGESKVSTWMYRIALNTALFHLNQSKKNGQRVGLEKINLTQENYDPILEERLAIMYQHIKALNDLEKGIILLFLEGKKHEEIAEITGITATNVGTRIGRIKQKLKETIKS